MKKCPYCHGEVDEAAKKCRHCGEWLTSQKTDSEFVAHRIKSGLQAGSTCAGLIMALILGGFVGLMTESATKGWLTVVAMLVLILWILRRENRK